MATTKRGKVATQAAEAATYADLAQQRAEAIAAAQTISDETLADLRAKWAEASKEERRASRLMDPLYVRTSEGLVNLRTCEVE